MLKASAIFIIHYLLITVTISAQELPTEESNYFSGSGNCVLCHESNGEAMTWNGIDVSPLTYWRSTMMGNASKDPLWRAMVQEEVHNFPQLRETIETTCTRCHAPIGYTEAIRSGQTGYSMAELKQDPLANDGVSCTVCHQIDPENFGSEESYSGHYFIDTNRVIYGPYENPDTLLMPLLVNYQVEYGPHMNHPELCATCHTLFTPYLDNQGNIAGYFPEQTPYLEWKNSIYPGQNTKCQSCHMPMIYDSIKISTQGNSPTRSPFWRHTFVGGNVYMLKLIKDNIDSIGATAEPEHFDSTISRAEYNLTDRSINLSTFTDFQNDSMTINVYLENLAGHKLPTGIPFRRMWIHLKVEEAGGPVIFESGEWNSEGIIPDYDTEFEPHYNIINSEDEVQVYEGVFVDVDLQVTYTLLRAAEFVKDNRIPPKGFTTSHNSYDSTGIFGNAVFDPNFNKDELNEGTGTDIVSYRVPARGNVTYSITAEVCYQSVKPELAEYLSGISEPDISKFIYMYNDLPNTPLIMKSITFDIVTGVEVKENLVSDFRLNQNYPNPFNPSTNIGFRIAKPGLVSLKVYNVLGNEVYELINKFLPAGEYETKFYASSLPSGIYYYRLKAEGFSLTRKMVYLK